MIASILLVDMRTLSRPRTNWRGSVNKNLQPTGLSWEESARCNKSWQTSMALECGQMDAW